MNPIEFSRNLFLLRRERRMTIEELSDALEVTPELICEWECAKTSPTVDQMNRLARVYGIPLAEIIRAPKPHEEPAASPDEPKSQPQTEEMPPESRSETESQPESKEDECDLPPETVRKRSILWDVIVIAVLLLLIAGGALALLKPEWFPFREWFGAAIPGLSRFLPR